jgi:hypothetical protein
MFTDSHRRHLQKPRLDEHKGPEAVGRMGKPEEIGEGVLWLLSDAASFVPVIHSL